MTHSRKTNTRIGTRGPLSRGLLPGDEWLSAPKAAVLLGKTRHTVRKRALRKEIRVKWVDGREFYHRDDVLASRERDEADATAAVAV